MFDFVLFKVFIVQVGACTQDNQKVIHSDSRRS